MTLPTPPLLLITDRTQARHPLAAIARAAFRAGCRWLSLREKDLAPDARLALLAELVALARPYRAHIMVHGDIAAAAAAGAAGVHLPSGGSVEEARMRLGAEALIGLSTHTGDEVSAAARAGADYVTLSPIFATASKPGYGPALGLDALARARQGAAVPILALGGITAANAAACLEAGAAGLAVMGTVMAAQDPEAAMAAILAAFDQGGRSR
ncbi:MAG: thiamine phosphate synthase [Alphaproteobacteria bacterium]